MWLAVDQRTDPENHRDDEHRTQTRHTKLESGFRNGVLFCTHRLALVLTTKVQYTVYINALGDFKHLWWPDDNV